MPPKRISTTKSPVWEHFQKGVQNGTFWSASCRYCGHFFQYGKAGEMCKHIARCRDAPPEVVAYFGKPSSAPLVKAESGPASATRQKAEAPAEGPSRSQSHAKATMEPSRQQGTGRRKVWENFVQGEARGNRYEATCRHCGKYYTAAGPSQMIHHISKQCQSVPEDIKNFWKMKAKEQEKIESAADKALAQWKATQEDRLAAVGLNAHQSSANEKASMAPNKHPIWIHFHQGAKTGRFHASTCKYCGHHSTYGKANEMVAHIRSRCTKVPMSVREQYESIPAAASGRRHTVTTLPHLLHCTAPEDSDEIFESEASPREVSLPKPVSKKRGVENGLNDAKRARADDENGVQEIMVYEDPSYLQIHEAIFRYFLSCKVPFATLDHPEFRNLLSLINPRITIPTSAYYLSEAVPELERNVDIILDTYDKQSTSKTYTSIGVSFVEATGYVISTSTVDYDTGLRHSVVRTFCALPQTKSHGDFDSCQTSAHYSVMELARETEITKLVNICYHPTLTSLKKVEVMDIPGYVAENACFLHAFEDIIRIFYEEKSIQKLLHTCHEFVTVLRTGPTFGLLQKLRSSNVELIGLNSCKPESVLLCIYSLLENQDAIKAVSDATTVSRVFGEGEEMELAMTSFWDQIDLMLSLFRPLLEAFIMVDRGNLTMGDAYYSMLSFAKKLTENVEKDETELPQTFLEACVIRYEEIFDRLTSPIYQLGYFLHPLFRGEGLQESLMNTIFLNAGEMSKTMGRTAEQTLTLIRQMKRFHDHSPPFDVPYSGVDSNPLAFWQNIPFMAGTEIQQLALRVMTMSPVSRPPSRLLSIDILRNPISVPESLTGSIAKLQSYYLSSAAPASSVERSSSDPVAASEKQWLSPSLLTTYQIEAELHPIDFDRLEKSVGSFRKDISMKEVNAVELIHQGNLIFDKRPIAWTSPNAVVKTEHAHDSKEYDVRELLMRGLQDD